MGRSRSAGNGKVHDLTPKLRSDPGTSRVHFPKEIAETFEDIRPNPTQVETKRSISDLPNRRETANESYNGSNISAAEAERLFNLAAERGLSRGAVVVRRRATGGSTQFYYSDIENWGIVTGHFSYPGPGDFYPLQVEWLHPNVGSPKVTKHIPDDLFCIRPGPGFRNLSADITQSIERQMQGRFDKVKYNGL